MIDDKTYQKIYDELRKYFVPNWEKVVVYLEYGKGSYAFSLYERIDDEYINVYDIPGVSENKIDASFKGLFGLTINHISSVSVCSSTHRPNPI